MFARQLNSISDTHNEKNFQSLQRAESAKWKLHIVRKGISPYFFLIFSLINEPLCVMLAHRFHIHAPSHRLSWLLLLGTSSMCLETWMTMASFTWVVSIRVPRSVIHEAFATRHFVLGWVTTMILKVTLVSTSLFSLYIKVAVNSEPLKFLDYWFRLCRSVYESDKGQGWVYFTKFDYW